MIQIGKTETQAEFVARFDDPAVGLDRWNRSAPLRSRLQHRQVRIASNAPVDVAGKEADAAGYIEGLLAVYEVLDSDNEVFRKGAFARSADQRVPAGQVPLMVRHMRDGGDVMDTVGVVTKAEDRDEGLWVHAEFFADELSQAAREKILEARERGATELHRLSVGFIPTRWAEMEDAGNGKWGVEFLEAKLLEATITVLPANEQAVILAAKSLKQAAEAETDIDVEAVRTGAQTILDVLAGKRPESDPPTPAPEPDVARVAARRHAHDAAALRRRLALM